MKKIIALLLAAMMMITCAVTFAENGMIAGGWNIPEDNAMTEDAQKAFEKATENLDGIKPVLLLGTQVVAGINYTVLAKVTDDNGTYFAALTIYADLAGNATITGEHVIPMGTVYEIEEGQNPVMNFIGDYQDEVSQRATLNIQAVEEDKALLMLHWANGADNGVEWVFTCEFDAETLTFTYEQGVKKNYICNEKGEMTYEIVAEDLAGTFTVNEDETITWNAEGDDADNGCKFVFAF